MATIYIDTNIIINESFFRSASVQAFLKACSLLRIEVVIPEIVMDEVFGIYKKKIEEKILAFQKSQKDLSRLVDFESVFVSKEDEFSKYQDWLYELIENLDIYIAPYPSVPLKEIIEKSYKGIKPFKDDGNGYKDHILWASIRTHIESRKEAYNNFFLTNNTHDFGKKDDARGFILHPDLAKQIKDERCKPKLHISLKGFFDKELSPKLEGISLEDIPDLDYLSILSITEKTLLDDLPQHSFFGLEGVPFSNDVSISGVGDAKIDHVQLAKIEDEVIINVSGTVELEVCGFMDKHAYYLDLEDKVDVSIEDADWNDHVMMVSASVTTAVELSLYYSLETKEVVGHEIVLPQEIQYDWL